MTEKKRSKKSAYRHLLDGGRDFSIKTVIFPRIFSPIAAVDGGIAPALFAALRFPGNILSPLQPLTSPLREKKPHPAAKLPRGVVWEHLVALSIHRADKLFTAGGDNISNSKGLHLDLRSFKLLHG